MNHNYAHELPARYLKHWGLLVDTGAYVSVAPKHFAPEVPLEKIPHPVQLLTATSTPIKIYGTKTVLLVTGKLSFHVRFYVTDVKQTLLGLQDLLQGELQLTLRDVHSSTIMKNGIEEPLLFHDKHFYVEALVLPQDHQLNYLWLDYLQNQLFHTTTTVYYTTGDGGVHEQVGEAQLPRSSKPPQLPSEEERLTTRVNSPAIPQLVRGLPTFKRQTSLPQTTTKRQRKCDTNGLRVPTGPTSTTRFTTTTTTDSTHNA